MLDQCGPLRIFLLTSDCSGLFKCGGRGSDLEFDNLSLSLSFSVIEQRCVYTEANIQGYMTSFCPFEREYLDMFSAFLSVHKRFFFLFYILKVDFASSNSAPVPKKGAGHHGKLQKVEL